MGEIIGSKKKHHFLRNLIIILVVIILLPIALLYILFFDPTQKDFKKIENFENRQQEIISNVFIDAFSYTSNIENPMISIKITEDLIDNLLYTAVNNRLGEAQKYITGIYAEIEEKDNTINFYVSGGIPIFKTRVCLSTSLGETEDGFSYEFKIKDARIGRLGGLQNIAKTFVTNDMLQSLLSNSGLSIVADLDNMRLTYAKADLIDDLTNLISISDPLINDLIIEFMKFDILHFDIDQDVFMINALLKSLKNNQYCYQDTSSMGVNQNILNEVKSKVALDLPTYVSQNKTEEDISAIFQAEINEKIAPLKKDSNSISNYITNQMPEINLLEHYADINFSLPESIINDFLFSNSYIGYSNVFYSKQENSSYNLVYLTLDNIYTKFNNVGKTEAIDLIVNFNINGCRISITFHTTRNYSFEDKLCLDVDNILIGEHEVSDTVFNALIDFLINALSETENNLFALKKDTTTAIPYISIDFEKIIIDFLLEEGINPESSDFEIFDIYQNIESEENNEILAGFKIRF